MKYPELTELIKQSKRIVFFGGAGVSTASGIPDFRSGNGLYAAKTKYGISPEEMISHEYFMYHTEEFYEYYKENLVYREAQPNGAHIALAELEKKGKLSAVITQNIDGLHQIAGSKRVVELHGTVLKNKCMYCGKQFNLDYVMEANGVPHCDKCKGTVKPEVVLYGEPLDNDAWASAEYYIKNSDLLIVGGTSLSVYPASSLVSMYNGTNIVLINKTETPYDSRAKIVIRDNIADVLTEAVRDAEI